MALRCGSAVSLFCLFVTGCDAAAVVDGAPDLSSRIEFSSPDLAVAPADLQGCGDPLNACGGDCPDPACFEWQVGPPNTPFPLQSDPKRDPGERDEAVVRDPNGYLVLPPMTVPSVAWIANASDALSGGVVSRVDAKNVREVARYLTVTCSSLKAGSSAPCDGTKGCCAVDDWDRYQARKSKQQEPGHQAVQLLDDSPSRTAIDANGDAFVANRAFGGQSSITKIAASQIFCIDRNHNGRIDTSADTSGDGWIDEDCNGDGKADDLASVKQKPCTNGLAQEFYGLDDECILWTANTFAPGGIGRSVALGWDAISSTAVAWAGAYQTGIFVGINGETGLAQADTTVGNNPHGAVVDGRGIAWSGPLGGPTLCYFDTNHPQDTACARTPQGFSVLGDGISLDSDENVWLGGGVMRYSPERTNGFRNLGNGYWMKIQGATGVGIAADGRGLGIGAKHPGEYFVWSCDGNGHVLRIPASTIPTAGRMGQPLADWQVDPANWPMIDMPCNAVGVDADQNVWGVTIATTTRALVDNVGAITQPKVNGAPKGNAKCPAGDSCPLAGAFAYSDFLSWPIRPVAHPPGTYSIIAKGCTDAQGLPRDTEWDLLSWDADVPPDTSLSVLARTSNAASPNDPSWPSAVWTPDANTSPLDLKTVLAPNKLAPMMSPVDDGFLQIEFTFKTNNATLTPKLKSISVGYRCDE